MGELLKRMVSCSGLLTGVVSVCSPVMVDTGQRSTSCELTDDKSNNSQEGPEGSEDLRGANTRGEVDRGTGVSA